MRLAEAIAFATIFNVDFADFCTTDLEANEKDENDHA